MYKLNHLLTCAIVALTLVACGKTISVKEDANNYIMEETKIQAELKPKQQELMNKLQAMQQTPEKIEEILPEINTFIADAKSKLQQIKPQTEAVKKFQAQNIQSLDKLSSFMSSVVDAVKTKDPTKAQNAQQVYVEEISNIKAAKAELMKEVAK